jgi:hypothetical protein
LAAWPQAASQQPFLPQPVLQQLSPQQPRSNRPRRPENRPQRLPQPLSQQPVSQQPFPAEPQPGAQQPLPAGPAQVASQQALPASQHDGSQQEDLQQPPPSMRSSRPAPKLWLQSPALSTSAPKNLENFIEQRLLCMELRAARRPNVAPMEPNLPVLLKRAGLLPRGEASCLSAALGQHQKVDPSVCRSGCVGRNPQFTRYEHQCRRALPWPESSCAAADVANGPVGAVCFVRTTYVIVLLKKRP